MEANQAGLAIMTHDISHILDDWPHEGGQLSARRIQGADGRDKVLLSFTRTGALPMARIGERLQVHPTSVTNTIDRLEADGLVARIPHPTDRRATLAEITPTGRDLATRAARALADADYGLDGMAERDLAAVERALGPLRSAAGDF